MKTGSVFLICIFLWRSGAGQPNCSIYKEDDPCYAACNAYLEAINYQQGTYVQEIRFDSAIALCPQFSHAWREKSVAYLKNGEFRHWKELIDKAVEYNPLEYLNVRAWCRFQFLRDYEGTLQDLDQLRKLNGVPGYSTNGDYDMRIVEALCYRELGDMQTSLRFFKDYLVRKESGKEPLGFGSYDYLHDGVTKLKAGRVREAMEAFDKQIAIYKQLPDTYYYYGIACRQLHEEKRARDYFNLASEFLKQGYSRMDPYTEPLDKVYPADIARALEQPLKK